MWSLTSDLLTRGIWRLVYLQGPYAGANALGHLPSRDGLTQMAFSLD